jgi:hypothetical protein
LKAALQAGGIARAYRIQRPQHYTRLLTIKGIF